MFVKDYRAELNSCASRFDVIAASEISHRRTGRTRCKRVKEEKKKSYADGKDGYLPGPRSAQGLGLDFDTLGGPVQ